MTSPVEFPMYGKFKKMELSKEQLLGLLGHGAEPVRLQRAYRREIG